MDNLKKILSKLKEEAREEDGFELLPADEASELEGGHQSSCPVNSSCSVNTPLPPSQAT